MEAAPLAAASAKDGNRHLLNRRRSFVEIGRARVRPQDPTQAFHSARAMWSRHAWSRPACNAPGRCRSTRPCIGSGGPYLHPGVAFGV